MVMIYFAEIVDNSQVLLPQVKFRRTRGRIIVDNWEFSMEFAIRLSTRNWASVFERRELPSAKLGHTQVSNAFGFD
jgi:hypothetical protein